MKIMISNRLFGLLTALLLAVAIFSLWTVSADTRAAASAPPPAPLAATEAGMGEVATLAAPPAPSPKSREEKRFARADRDDDGLISQSEYLSTRRRNYDKLDSNGDGRLSFEEYAASGIEKFAQADSNGNQTLETSEFATTAPKPKKPIQTAANCACPPAQTALADD